MSVDDLLIEIHTEELPPTSLLTLGEAFQQQIKERLAKSHLPFKKLQWFATPRRLAVLVRELAAAQPSQVVERKGPARKDAFTETGAPTSACTGFATSCGVTPADLITLTTPQGEWMGYRSTVAGQSVRDLLPAIVQQAAMTLPIPKRMRWGESDVQFIRPVHSVMLLYGNDVIDATILGCKTGRQTRGHRFHAEGWIDMSKPADYEGILEKNHVIADFNRRREMIREQASAIVKKTWGEDASIFIESEAFLNEVTALVEWPVALSGKFDAVFLSVPSEVLISSMQDHQRYFPVKTKRGDLLPYFVTISNIESRGDLVIHGNERVLRARLSDAKFFYEADQKTSLAARFELLRGIVFQEKLGTFFDKAMRLSLWIKVFSTVLHVNQDEAKQAAHLAKTDLTTEMVGEFPELQGVMGDYYARHDGEAKTVAIALREQYHPRFAGDTLPDTPLGQLLAIADRIDNLVGAFGTGAIPTSDKDPFGLRRAALGVLRILIEKEIDLDLNPILKAALAAYQPSLSNQEAVPQILSFMQDRLRAWYLEQGMTTDIFAAVTAIGFNNPLDLHRRMKAVQAFKQLAEAAVLCAANKRVSQILSKYTDAIPAIAINPALFEHDAEKKLAEALASKSEKVSAHNQKYEYTEALKLLATLQQPIDHFFDEVMVMTDDQSRRENRIVMLQALRGLFLQVADIALLQ